jgi:hypothetical protein
MRDLPAGRRLVLQTHPALSMRYPTISKLMILLTLANGSPVAAKRILGSRLSRPLDGNIKFLDGQPLFGSSKTVRGVVVSILVTAASAPFLGMELKVGFRAGIGAMLGDLFSSFLKRRLKLPPSREAIGLDQIPESLFPLLACRQAVNDGHGYRCRHWIIFHRRAVALSSALQISHPRPPVLMWFALSTTTDDVA